MPEVRANGIRLYFEEHGEGAPILGIHGSGSSAILMWAEAVEPLAGLGRLILYDRRGHSRSERPEPFVRMTRDEEAADAAALLDALDAAPAIVIGRSHGGEVALELAHRYPEHVRALALLEASPAHLEPEAEQWVESLNERIRAAAARDPGSVGETLIEEVLGDGAWESLPAQAREMFTENGPAILAEIEGTTGTPDEQAVRSIRQPTLVVSAEDSAEPLRRLSARLAALLPNAEAIRVEGGHIIDPAHPEVLRFVERFA